MGGYKYNVFVEEKTITMYNYDENCALRSSDESPVVKMIYEDYFEKPGTHKAHELLHTTYVPRGNH